MTTIRELVRQLEKIQNIHGNCEVLVLNKNGYIGNIENIKEIRDHTFLLEG